MAIQYAGGTRVNFTFTDSGTKTNLVNNLETQLLAAGWSAISGAGTGDVILESAAAAGGLKIQVRMRDDLTNTARFNIRNSGGSLESQDHFLQPNSVQWRIVANRYWFLMFRTGAAARTTARSTLFGGTIWTPEFIHTPLGTLYAGFMAGGANADTDTNARTTWRSQGSPASNIRGTTIIDSNLINYALNTSSGMPSLLYPSATDHDGSRTSMEWGSGDRHIIEAVIGWSSGTNAANRVVLWGQLYDAVVLQGQFTGENNVSHDGHTWLVITDLATAASGSATLCVRTSN
jgi:hypothetical protein